MTTTSACDVLAFGAHPDDIELSCGGMIATLTAKGYRVVIADLSRGERGTNGTVETRAKEAQAASKALGTADRVNLALPDGGINPYDVAQLHQVVSCIRKLQPSLLLAPYWEERHPDHVAASELLTRAIFFANVGGFDAAPHNNRHAVAQVLYYQMRIEFRPSFIMDVSPGHARKLEAIRCFASQVGESGEGKKTLLNSERTLSAIEARDKHYGAMAGVEYGEPFLTRNTLAISDPVTFFKNQQQPLFFLGKQ